MNMIDCASPITQVIAATLTHNNVSHVGRYLTGGWKGLKDSEIQVIKDTGLNLISIYETNPISSNYFTRDQGIQDANAAYNAAKGFGQPEQTAIYFTVDFDAQTKDFVGILNYFQGIKDTLTSYKIGCYGKFQVIQLIQSKKLADYFYQTYAWSSGQHASGIHIFQYRNDISQYGLNCDLNQVENMECGAWGEPQEPTNKPIMVVKVLQPSDVRALPDHASNYLGNVQPGQMYNVWMHTGDWHYIILDPSTNLCGWVDGNNGNNLYWLDNPALNASATQTYKIQDGDTLVKIAGIFKTSVQNLLTLNPNISNPNKIYAGQVITVPKN